MLFNERTKINKLLLGYDAAVILLNLWAGSIGTAGNHVCPLIYIFYYKTLTQPRPPLHVNKCFKWWTLLEKKATKRIITLFLRLFLVATRPC